MFVIFGWEKTIKPEESILTTHCYHCKNDTQWSIWKETEWVSLFFINILPIINKYYLGCGTCGDSAKLEKKFAEKIRNKSNRNSKLHDDLVQLLEKYQFDGLTEGQRNYRKSQKEGMW